MKKIITGLFAIAAFTFSAGAQDQGTDGQRKWNKDSQGMHRGHDGKEMESLNLTDAQKQQVKTINEEFRTRMQSLNSNDNMVVKDQKAQRQALIQEKNNRISALLNADQKIKFGQMQQQHEGRFGERSEGNNDGKAEGREGRFGGGDRADHLKTELGLSDDQAAKIKAGNESFKQRVEAIRNNQSLSEDQKKSQFEALRKDREASMKSYLTADQIAKFDAIKKNRGDHKNKSGEWKEKRKSEDGKEKIKVKEG